MSPDMNPIEHVWDFIGRKLNKRVPRYRNIAELTNAILEEWRRFPQAQLRRLVLGMRRLVPELERNRGGYTRYKLNLCDKAAPYVHLKVLKFL